jgi:hypothetical protein
MVNRFRKPMFQICVVLGVCLRVHISATASAADKLVGLHSAQVLSQSMPWIAQEAGLFIETADLAEGPEGDFRARCQTTSPPN